MVEKAMFFVEKEFLVFLIQWIFVFLITGTSIAGLFQKLFNKNNGIHFGFLLIIGIGFAPMFLATVLYYLYVLLPNLSTWVYLSIELLAVTLVFFMARKQTLNLLLQLKNEVVLLFRSYKLISSVVSLGILFFLFIWSFYLTNRPISEHDTMEYAVQGKTFYEDAIILYEPIRINANGFYYVGLHGFSFVLQATNERLMNEFFGVENDLFFRSINSTFGLIVILGFCFFGYLRNGLAFSIFLCFGLLLSFGIFETMIKFHIDNFRIFYFVAALYGSWRYVIEPNFRMLLFVSILLGAQANAHTLGCLLAILSFGSLFLFDKEKFATRLKNYAIAFCFFLLFGGLHYVLDVAFGTGWIFQEIKFY